MKIGIIGAGNIGASLARKLGAAGHSIKLANSRGPESLAAIAAEVGATAVPVADVVRDVELVIVSIPIQNMAQLPQDLFDGVAEDVVVVDTANYYPQFLAAPIDAIEQGMLESRWVAGQLRRPVIKAFNSITAHSLAHEGRPAGAAGRIALPVAGDEARAKALVIGLVDALGFDGIDAGGLDDSWRQQPGTPAYCTDYDVDGVRQGLASADRARAPQLRDAGMAKFAQAAAELPNMTPQDIIQLIRSINQ